MPGEIAKRSIPAEPESLLALALEKGADVGTIERLVALSKDMHAVQAQAAYHAAMVRFQSECPTIAKDRKATIGDKYDYTYASLPAVLAEIKATLTACLLSVSWKPEAAPAGHVAMRTLIAHAMGHVHDAGVMTVPVEAGGMGATGAQRVGIARTYAARYGLYNALGLAPDDDDDAREHGGDTTNVDRETGEVAPPRQAPPTSDKALCPTCKAPLFKNRDKPGYFCWAKRGGCGRNVSEADLAGPPPFVDRPVPDDQEVPF